MHDDASADEVAPWHDNDCAEVKAGTTLSSGVETLRAEQMDSPLLCFCWPGCKVQMMLMRVVWVPLLEYAAFSKSPCSDPRAR